MPLANTFPLPVYDVMPAAPPWVDSEPVLGDGRLLYYQADTIGNIFLTKTTVSVALHF